jgi:hypothetical protein
VPRSFIIKKKAANRKFNRRCSQNEHTPTPAAENFSQIKNLLKAGF